MTPGRKMILTSVADFVLAAGSTVTGAMMQEGAVVLPNAAVLVLALVAGLVAAFSHVRASLAAPPPAGG